MISYDRQVGKPPIGWAEIPTASVSVEGRRGRQVVQMCVEADVLHSPVETSRHGVCFYILVPLNYFKGYYSMASIFFFF